MAQIGLDGREGLFTGSGEMNLKARCDEPLTNEFAGLQVVIDDEQLNRANLISIRGVAVRWQ